MKTKIYLTIFTMIMSVQIAVAQQIIYGDNMENITNEEICKDGCQVSNIDHFDAFNIVDDGLASLFKTENNTEVVCRLSPDGTESFVICSASTPEKGWGNMVSNTNDGAFTYEEKLYNDGANIFSIVYTDPKNGWAVGVMENGTHTTGVIFNTLNGGITWNIQFKSGTEMKLKTIGFTNAEVGWAKGIRIVGNKSFNIKLSTFDGGLSWDETNLSAQ